MRAVWISISGIDLHLFQRKKKTVLAKHFFLCCTHGYELYEQPELDHLRYTLQNTLVGSAVYPHAGGGALVDGAVRCWACAIFDVVVMGSVLC